MTNIYNTRQLLYAHPLRGASVLHNQRGRDYKVGKYVNSRRHKAAVAKCGLVFAHCGLDVVADLLDIFSQAIYHVLNRTSSVLITLIDFLDLLPIFEE
jgi:hypothetical protein